MFIARVMRRGGGGGKSVTGVCSRGERDFFGRGGRELQSFGYTCSEMSGYVDNISISRLFA